MTGWSKAMNQARPIPVPEQRSMKLPFLFGIHCHQPVDNFHSVVDEAIANCYRPFMQALAQFPDFKCAVHFSGWLLAYIRKHAPSLFSDMQHLSRNGQIEFFTGGFYEPVLAAIPARDRKGQIQKLSDYIGEHFGQVPQGLWLTERVWDAAIVPDLAACKVNYLVVDDYHFLSSGYDPGTLHGYYLTEQDGISLAVFPIDQQLRYLTPFKPFSAVSQYLETLQVRPQEMAMVFDDGEKFGIWPKTYQWVYEEKWLNTFLEGICLSNTVTSTHFADFFKSNPPKGLAYLPTTAYMEMGEWSLFADKIQDLETLKNHLKDAGLSQMIRPFIKGGIWKNFFAKYPESNWIHKRCLQLSKLACDTDDPRILDSLYRSQCNDVLWHGLFGGLYLPNLRNNAYTYIIETAALLEKSDPKKAPAVLEADVSLDGYKNIALTSTALQAWFTAKDGGQLVELGCRRTKINLLNTLARRKEGYHKIQPHASARSTENEKPHEGISTIHDQDTAIDLPMEKHLVHDWYNRYGFIDHIVKDFSLSAFKEMTFTEMGDFVNQPVEISCKKDHLIFSRHGGIYEQQTVHPTVLKKQFSLDHNTLNFSIALKTSYPAQLTYVLETNWHVYNDETLLINQMPLSEQHCFSGQEFMIQDKTMPLGFTLLFDQKVELQGFTVQTVSQSEKGFDLTTQGICLLVPVTGIGNFSLSGAVRITDLD